MPAQATSVRSLWIRNQYDTAPPLRLTVYDEAGDPLPLHTLGITATIDIAYQSGSHYYSPRGRIITDEPMVVTGASAPGELQFIPEEGDWDIAGHFHIKVTIIYPDGSTQRIPDDYPLSLKINERVGGP
jgi:hypothetical protein